ncbi:MAG: Fic family protein [Bacteroidales bacterium]|jgi:fido (protein-threonine AMPylation protein)|nr:Fic family protein [Bacteroidales bacterium]
MSEFDEYIRNGEPDKKEKALSWKTAIGLQAVDGLQISDYLKDTAVKHIEGDISIDEVKELINSYYQSKTVRTPNDEDTEEADKVSANIARILNEKSFAYSVTGFTSIHRRLFEGVFKFAGNIRDYDITKKEWVLCGDTVLYVNAEDLHRAIEYDLEQEKNFSYKGLSLDEVVFHIAKFVSKLWQIHPFGEGNTRTTAVFIIKYLRSIGFDVNNDLFAEHSWYFRNALVRANYRNVRKGVEPDISFLILFFRNLMMNESNELKNRNMIVNTTSEIKKEQNPTSTRQVPDKLPTSSNEVHSLIEILAEQQLSIKEILAAMNLKDRENFMVNYLNPAMKEGVVVMLYPNSPKHPRQKYLLTDKGLVIYNSI